MHLVSTINQANICQIVLNGTCFNRNQDVDADSQEAFEADQVKPST